MSQRMSPSEQLAYSTIRIECMTQEGPTSGTGFFFRFADRGEEHVPAIVTNKHVVNGAITGRFVLTEVGDNEMPMVGQYQKFQVNNFESQWLAHPDPEIDLCVMPIAPLLSLAQERGKQFFYKKLDETLIPTPEELEELNYIEDVVMVGYPNGIWDEKNNMPVFRQGITATHPSLDWNGRPEFIIDIACFPGSSGSPVLLYNIGSYTKSTGTTVLGAHRIKLLGILYAGPIQQITGEIEIVEIPTENRPIPVSTIPINLGIVIKSSTLSDFDELFSQMKG